MAMATINVVTLSFPIYCLYFALFKSPAFASCWLRQSLWPLIVGLAPLAILTQCLGVWGCPKEAAVTAVTGQEICIRARAAFVEKCLPLSHQDKCVELGASKLT